MLKLSLFFIDLFSAVDGVLCLCVCFYLSPIHSYIMHFHPHHCYGSGILFLSHFSTYIFTCLDNFLENCKNIILEPPYYEPERSLIVCYLEDSVHRVLIVRYEEILFYSRVRNGEYEIGS